MKSFKDNTGHTWEFAITIGSVLRVKSLLGLDLLDLTSVPAESNASGLPQGQSAQPPQPLGVRVTTDVVLFARVLFALVSNQPAAAELDESSFADRLDGAAYETAFDGFTAELDDFFRKTGRSEQAHLLATQLDLLTKIHAAATEKIATLDVDRAVSRARKEIDSLDLNAMLESGNPSSNSPELSALTPAA